MDNQDIELAQFDRGREVIRYDTDVREASNVML